MLSIISENILEMREEIQKTIEIQHNLLWEKKKMLL